MDPMLDDEQHANHAVDIVQGSVDDDAYDTPTPDSGAVDDREHVEIRDGHQYLRASYALGTRSCGRQLVEFSSESAVVYPVGHHVCILHMETRAMEFFSPTQCVRSIQAFRVAANRELIAIVEIHPVRSLQTAVAPSVTATKTTQGSLIHAQLREQAHQQHILAIYRMSSRIRVKAINLPHNSNVVSCSFSSDNKFLVLLEDAPTHNVTYWKVSTGKLVASCKCPSRGSRIFINPNNPNYISVSGPMILKYWVWTNNDFKIGNLLPPTREQEHFVDHIWIKEHMVAVSERGVLLFFCSTSDSSGVDLIHSSRCHQPSYVRLECLASHAKGFVLAGSAGFFTLYEYSDDPKDPFAFVRSVSVGEAPFDSVSISPNMESIVASTKSQELLTFSLGGIDTVQEDRVEYRELLRGGNQVGAVLQVDSCLQRPILASCGVDKTVRLWNFELRQCEVIHQCVDEPVGLALHPSGFFIVVTFKERVRLFYIMQESLRQIRELLVKSCRVVRFSNGGHLFACAAGLAVSVFRTHTCELVNTFSGHIGAVKSVAWTKDDYFLYSAAHDGSVYRWNMFKGTRCEELQHNVKQCQYSVVLADHRDPRSAFVAGSDGKIRELYCGDEAITVDLPHGVCITAMAKDRNRIFAGTNTGSIMVFSLPLTNKSCIYECHGHATTITFMRVTDDNELLLSSSEDGSVQIFQLVGHSRYSTLSDSQRDSPILNGADASESARTQDKKQGAFSDAILIAREDLEEQKANITELQHRYDQVKADVEFSLHRKENEWIDRLRGVKEESESMMVQERIRYEELEHRHQQMQRKHAEDMAHKEANHVKMTQELENQYERKLAQEIARYDEQSEILEQTRQRCEALIEAQDTQHRNMLHVERKSAYSRSKEQNEIIKRLHDDLKYNHVKFEEVLHQEEVDYEQELQLLRASYEKQLEAERQNTAVKQGLLSATNTKLESLKKKMQELKASSHARDILLSTERAKIANLEGTLSQYEKHFDSCKFNIADKEKEIGGLKSSNRILENFRSVLHHRIDNMEAAKSPMQAHMVMMETQIHDMQNELADEYQAKAIIQQDIENKNIKVKTLLQEVKILRQSVLKKEYVVNEIVREITRMAKITDFREMEAAVKDAYRVFAMGEPSRKKPPLTHSKSSEQECSSPSTKKSVLDAHSAVLSPSKRDREEATSIGNVRSLPLSSPASGNMRPSLKNGNQSGQSEVTGTNQSNPGITDEALGYDEKQTLGESVKQVEHMSKTIMTLRATLENTKAKADRIRRDAVAEGSILIEECNKLRKENKLQQMRIREMEHQLSTCRDGPLSPVGARTSKKLVNSNSCHQIASPSPGLCRDNDSDSIEASLSPSCKLMPIFNTSSLKSQQHAVPSMKSPTARHVGKPPSPLPFARLELERNKRSGAVAKVDELNSTIAQQRNEIERLQMQVQLLMTSEEPGQTTRSSRFQEACDLTGQLSTGRLETLRPITLSGSNMAQPLHSSFVLTPKDCISLDEPFQ